MKQTIGNHNMQRVESIAMINNVLKMMVMTTLKKMKGHNYNGNGGTRPDAIQEIRLTGKAIWHWYEIWLSDDSDDGAGGFLCVDNAYDDDHGGGW